MRKKFIGLALYAMLFALCSSAGAQQPVKIARIGFLDNSTASSLGGPFGGVSGRAEQAWID